MTLEQLRIFMAVAQRGHLTQAASALALTPSAVSSAIRALEQRYDTQLFDRVGRGIVLTEAGRLFMDQARVTLASAAAAEQALAELHALKRGHVRVQASQTIASYHLPRALVTFRERYPSVTVTLEVGNTRSVASAVRAGEADLGLVEGEVEGDTLEVTPIGTDRILIVVPPQHRWADGAPLSAQQLLTSRWISREAGSGTRSVFETTLRHSGVDPSLLDIVLTLPSNEAVRGAVEASGRKIDIPLQPLQPLKRESACLRLTQQNSASWSGGYAAALSQWVAQPALDAGRLKRARFALAPRDFSLLTHKQRYRTRAAQALIEILMDQA